MEMMLMAESASCTMTQHMFDEYRTEARSLGLLTEEGVSTVGDGDEDENGVSSRTILPLHAAM